MWKIIINDNEYQLSMPITFSEVYSNELDSAKVEISHITERIELAPCMPIILTNNDDLLNDWSNNLFTRVMLIDNFKEIQINIFEEIYNYELELCSLTKMLELYTGDTTISITQSRDNSVTLYTLKDALEKVLSKISKNSLIKVKDGSTWKYDTRFKYDSDLLTEFQAIKCPEFRFNSLTFREILTRLFSVKNYIPKVNNDFTISYLDMSLKNVSDMNLLQAQTSASVRSGDSRTNADTFTVNMQNVITETSNGIDNLTSTFQYVGFRNYTQPAISSALQNLELNTYYPIYKVNKFYLVGYFQVYYIIGGGGTAPYSMMWYKLDISPLVMYGKERAALQYKPTDAELNEFNTTKVIDTGKLARYNLKDLMDFMSKYQCYTLEYEQGGKKITGFNNSVKGLVYDTEIIKNIVSFLSFPDAVGNPNGHQIVLNTNEFIMGYRQNPQYTSMSTSSGANDPYSRVLFLIEYQPQSSITLDVSKNTLDEKKIESAVYDNQNGSMINAELSGNNEYSKIEKQGRNLHTIQSRVNTLSGVQPIPSQLGKEICYKRDLEIYDNFINVAYFLQEKHLLLNYYNEVSSKERAWELAENYYQRQARDKYYVLLSQKQIPDSLSAIGNITTLARSLLDTESYSKDYFGVEYALVGLGGVNYIATELDKHQFGRSIVLSYSFYDNVIAGVNIKSNAAEDGFSVGGYVQEYIKYGNENGYLQNLNTYFVNNVKGWDGTNYYELPKDRQAVYFAGNDPMVSWGEISDFVQLAPKFIYPSNFVSAWNDVCYLHTETQIDKDNKEALSLSTQIEYCSDNDDIIIYPNMIKNSAILNSRENKNYFLELTNLVIITIPSASQANNYLQNQYPPTANDVGKKYLVYNEDTMFYYVYELIYVTDTFTPNDPYFYYKQVAGAFDIGDYVYYQGRRYIIGDETLSLDPLHNGLPTGWKIIVTSQTLTRDTTKLSDIETYSTTTANYSFIATGFDNTIELDITSSLGGNLAIINENDELMLGINEFVAGTQVYYFNVLKHPSKKVYENSSEIFASYEVSDEDYNEFN